MSNQNWGIKAGAPAWLTEALASPVAPLSGAYSFVYPLGPDQIVKLVPEVGAYQFLILCKGAKGLPHLPVVHEVWHEQVQNGETQEPYWAFRLEKLEKREAVTAPFAAAYRHWVHFHEQAFEDNPVCNSELSRLALISLAQSIRPCHTSLAASLEMLASEASANRWAVDLGSSSNWMVRANGTVVLSDPAHNVDNFADDLV